MAVIKNLRAKLGRAEAALAKSDEISVYFNNWNFRLLD